MNPSKASQEKKNKTLGHCRPIKSNKRGRDNSPDSKNKKKHKKHSELKEMAEAKMEEVNKVDNMDNRQLLTEMKSMMSEQMTKQIEEVNKSIKSMFAIQINEMKKSFEKTIADAMKLECEKMKEALNADVDNLTERLTALENKPAPTYAALAGASSSGIEKNIVLRNVPQEDGEDVMEKVQSVLKDGCQVENVNIEAVSRKKNRNKDKPGVIVATLENKEQQQLVMANKSKLNQQDNAHHNVFIHEDVSYEKRITSQNWKTFIKASHMDDKLEVKGNRVVNKHEQRKQRGAENRPT